MDCQKDKNRMRCNCTYEPCPRKGMCCECLAYHLRSRELPACCFPASAEKTFDRSFEHFAQLVQSRVV
ncbi:MAG: cytosolic protein [Deltaproteobacteria bacterium]|nr:cytosolic protein [Deltaproteobacteria bacterium]